MRKYTGFGIEGARIDAFSPSTVWFEEQEHWGRGNTPEPVSAGWHTSELFSSLPVHCSYDPKSFYSGSATLHRFQLQLFLEIQRMHRRERLASNSGSFGEMNFTYTSRMGHPAHARNNIPGAGAASLSYRAMRRSCVLQRLRCLRRSRRRRTGLPQSRTMELLLCSRRSR
jgi:hypothetical protein